MELLIHLKTSDVLRTYRKMPVFIPERLVMHIREDELPNDWSESSLHPTTQDIGDRWLEGAESAAPGFTLLELLVVLVLVGLVTALAFPNLERLQGAVTSKTERDYILDQFAGLGREAMLRRRAYVVFGSDRAQDAGRSDIAGGTADATAQDRRAWPAGDGSGPSSFAGHDRYAIDLPEGWEIRLDEPLVVYANGLCLGAGLALYRRGEEDSRIVLDPPYCRVAPDA